MLHLLSKNGKNNMRGFFMDEGLIGFLICIGIGVFVGICFVINSYIKSPFVFPYKKISFDGNNTSPKQ